MARTRSGPTMPSAPKPRPPQPGDHVFLVDGSSYIFRAYHALPPLTRKSDKDLMQLVGDTVVMYDTMKDRRIGREEVLERFGVGPEKVIEVQALIGDSTDNVPGVPGIGVKTAAQLIAEYGDLETLLARAGEIKQEKRRQSLLDNADKARLSKRLVTLDTRVKLDVPLAELAVHEPDYKRLIAFLK